MLITNVAFAILLSGVFALQAQTLGTLTISALHYDPATGVVEADIVNASKRDITAAELRVTGTASGGDHITVYGTFDMLPSIGLEKIPMFAPPAKLQGCVRVGAIHPGQCYHYLSNIPPSLGFVDMEATSVIFLGGDADGNEEQIAEIFAERQRVAQEYASINKDVQQSTNVAALDALVMRVKKDHEAAQRAAMLPDRVGNAPQKRAVVAIKTIAVLLEQTSGHIHRGEMNTEDALGMLKIYMAHVTQVSSQECIRRSVGGAQ